MPGRSITDDRKKLMLDAAHMVYGTFDIPAEVIDEHGNRTVAYPEEIRHFAICGSKEIPELTGIYIEGDLLAYMVLSMPDFADEKIFMGPAYLRHPAPSEKEALKNILERHYPDNLIRPEAVQQSDHEAESVSLKELRQEIREYTECLPVYSVDKLTQIIQFTYWAICHQYMDVETLLRNTGEDRSLAAETEKDYIKAAQAREKLMRRESVKPHNSYYQEMEEYEAVRAGNVERLRELLKRPVAGTPGILSEDPLRNAKNLFISTITMLTRTAVQGGVTQEEAYNMSDAYIYRSEHSRSLKDVYSLRYQAMTDFTEKVAELKNKKCSPMVELCIDYIYVHLHHEIKLEAIAREVPVSPSHLSRIFKKEVGVTISSYIQMQRVEAARNMLRFSEYTYADIAGYLNFKSQSYFIVVFKRIEGITPMEYRRRYGGFEKTFL